MIGRASWKLVLVALVVAVAMTPSIVTAEEGKEPPKPVTTGAPDIPVAELELLLQPLTKGELLTEAGGWQKLVQQKSEEIADVEIVIKRLNTGIEEATEAKASTETAISELEKATKALTEARTSGEEAAVKTAEEKVEDARAAVADAEELAAATAVDAEGNKERVEELAETAAALREERTHLNDRLIAVLEAIEAKTDKADAETLKTIKDYRLYITAASGLQVDIEDTKSAWLAIKGWVMSEEGGQRWLINIAVALGIFIAAWILSKIISALVHRGLKAAERTSALLVDFLVGTVRWLIILIGAITALAALEVSVGPMLAALGAAGFVIAFALQDSLGNVASGLMILFFKPFDVDDVVTAGGVTGKVATMNLVSTTIRTFDNQRMVVPNNKIWHDVITNTSGVDRRRVDMEFGIGYADDADKAQAILEDIVAKHPKVLEDPEPMVKMHTLADNSVNFICWPWAEPADFGTVRWDIIREVKKRFDEAGLNIPFPQRDVHLYLEDGGARKALGELGTSNQAAAVTGEK
jgi:small conductance mechanosensitive channel